ncbi:hypothetical protein DB345_09770 [Spartobacteria bacterium LR76]|nr:hypothetical protein DB345_09770 [Spartobacteria bacterium LR76]
MKIDFRKSPPSAPRGFPLAHVHFSGGRTGMTVASHGGLINLIYYGRQSLGGASLFRSSFAHSSWPKLFRLVLEVDGRGHYPGFHNTRLYPFGFETEGRFQDVRYGFQMFLLNDALVQRVRILENPRERRMSLKVVLHGFVNTTPGYRTWTPWVPRPDGLGVTAAAVDRIPESQLLAQIEDRKKNPVQNPTFENTDVAEAETHVGLLATQALTLESTGGVHEGFKHYLRSDLVGDEAAFTVCFSPSEETLTARMRELRQSACADCDALVLSYHTRLSTAPRIEVQPPALRSCLENIPAVLDSLKVADLPGGMRAAAHGYWVWSWDDLVYPEAHLFAGDADFVRDALRFAVKTADPVLGIPHQFNTRLVPQMVMAFPAQCLFITTLYSYYCHTGDRAFLGEALPLAFWILEKCGRDVVAGTGLVRGTSLYPDFPGLMGQDGQDISSFNNSIYYQALAAMSRLTAHLAAGGEGDRYRALSEDFAARAAAAREAFVRHFFDEEKGYFYDSISAVDLTPRQHYPVYAILWTTPFARDLLGGHEKRIAAFMNRNFLRPHGLGMYPGWDAAWMRDGNQCGAYYPVVEPFFRNVMALAGRSAEIKAWTRSVAWFWSSHTIPEGLTYETESELPDNPGTKQAFAAKAWYGLFFRTVLGLEAGLDGLSVNPGPFSFPVEVSGLKFRGRSVDIGISGKPGRAFIDLNGRRLSPEDSFIPYDMLGEDNRISIVCGSDPDGRIS